MKSDIQMDGQDRASTLNEALIDELKAKSQIYTPAVEAAFRAVLRHLFVPDVSLDEAYTNRSIPTKFQDRQAISSSSEPSIMAIMLEQLDLKPGQKVLEIGAGTGYNAALMAHIVGQTGQVITIDFDEDIVANAKAHLLRAGFGWVQVICADGGYGYGDAAPYDRIILTVGTSDILPVWQEQMHPNGRLVLPLAIKEVQRVIAFEQSEGHLMSVSVKDGQFMPLRGQFATPLSDYVQVGPHPNLLVQSIASHPIDGEEIYSWLTGASNDWDTGVSITNRELLSNNLRLWMALHIPNICILSAFDDGVGGDLVPPLLAFNDERKTVITGILFNDKGMAAVMQPPNQPISLIDINNPNASDAPFNLYVRQYGSDEAPAHQLIKVVKSWDEVGRPTSQRLQVRVYPKAARYRSMESELIVDCPENQLILDWKDLN